MPILLSDQSPEPRRLVGDVRPLTFAPPILDRRHGAANLFDAFLVALGWLDESMDCVQRGRLHERMVEQGRLLSQRNSMDKE